MTPGQLWQKFATPIRREWPMLAACTLFLAPVCFIGLLKQAAGFDAAIALRDAAGMLRALFCAYILTAIASASGNVAIKWAIYTITLVSCILAATAYYMFGMDISPRMFTLLAETGKAETASFFKSFIGLEMAASAAACIFGIITFAVAERHIRRPAGAFATSAVSVLVIAGGILFTEKTATVMWANDSRQIEACFPGYHSDNPTKTFYSLHAVSLMSDENARWTKRLLTDAADHALATDTIPGDTLDIVLIIGESHIRNHSQLYGYPLSVTPFQTAEARAGRLVAFDSVTAVSRYTSGVMRSALSLASHLDGEAPADGAFLPLLFKKAGWEVYFLDNQHAGDDVISSYTLNGFLYNDAAMRHAYTYTSTYSNPHDDLDFVRHEQAATAQESRQHAKRLWIYHLWGQHLDPADRYPGTDSCRVFGKGHYGFRREPWLSAATRQRIADYDNATLHNDRTIKAILTAHKNRPTIAIYFSDHGEEVYDFRNAYGRIGAHDSMSDRTAIKKYIDALYGVPFEIWCSDAYIARHPGALESIKRHIMRPATTDLVGHTLLNLSGISSPAYRPDLDMLNPAYRPRHGMTPSRLGQAE